MQPRGCPRATAPPLGLTFSTSRPSFWQQYVAYEPEKQSQSQIFFHSNALAQIYSMQASHFDNAEGKSAHLGCESFIELEDVNVIDAKAGLLDSSGNGHGRADAHDGRIHAHGCE